MKKTQAKKKSKKKLRQRYQVIELPADNEGMEKYVEKNRVEISNRIVENIEYALNARLMGVEIFCFKDSNFVVVLNRNHFKESLADIFEFSLDTENFELCEKVKKTMGKMEKLSYVFTYKKTK